jgi:hypothetical protein
MEDVTNLFSTYRECVRHLWNAYFRPVAEPTQNWDVRDEFDTVARGIFSSLVLQPLSASDRQLSPESAATPSVLPGFRIVPASEHGAPILINRDLPRSGYWDHPVSEVRPADVELHLLRFFDFDQLGWRDYRYFEVVIHSSPTHPDIIGRAALIEFVYAKVLFSKTAA